MNLTQISKGILSVILCSFLLVESSFGLSLPSASLRLETTKVHLSPHLHHNIHSNDDEEDYTSSLNHVPRAGANDEHFGTKNIILAKFRKLDKEKVGMTIALFSTYFTVMGAKCALPSTLSLLTSKETGLLYQASENPQRSMAKVLSLSTMAIAFGKVLFGPLIDKFGGVLCLQVALSLLAVSLGIIASAVNFSTFAWAWIFVDFIFSSCWAACLNAIHQSFSEQEWASKIGTLATAARTGNAVSFLTFASILQLAQTKAINIGVYGVQPWRIVFLIASLIQVVPIILLAKFGGAPNSFKSIKKNKGTSDMEQKSVTIESTDSRKIRDNFQVLSKETRKPEFWFHLVNRSVQMVLASFLLFVPSYMSNCFGMSHSSAASVGSVYALGCLLAVSFGSQRYTALNKRGKIASIISMTTALLLICLLNLCHISGALNLSPLAGTICMFFWGLSFAIPFYIPASMYALRRGGRESSATIADMFDFGGFMLLALFNGYVAGIQQNIKSSWFMTYGILSVCSVFSMLSLTLATIWET